MKFLAKNRDCEKHLTFYRFTSRLWRESNRASEQRSEKESKWKKEKMPHPTVRVVSLPRQGDWWYGDWCALDLCSTHLNEFKFQLELFAFTLDWFPSDFCTFDGDVKHWLVPCGEYRGFGSDTLMYVDVGIVIGNRRDSRTIGCVMGLPMLKLTILTDDCSKWLKWDYDDTFEFIIRQQ